MSDADQVNQAIAELWDIVKCRCHEAYTGRGLHDPDCQCDSTDAVKTVADRIEALTEQLAAAQHDAKEAEAYAEELERDRRKTYEALLLVSRLHSEVEDKLAKAVEALEDLVRDCEADYPPSHGAIKYFARATLAEIKGESHE